MPTITVQRSITRDDTANIAAAFADAQAGDTVRFEPGPSYIFKSPIVSLGIPFTIEAEGALLVYEGADNTTALTFGYAPGVTADGFGPRWTFNGITLETTLTRGSNSAVGLCLQNIYCGTARNLGLYSWGTGLQLVADGTACSYGHYHCRQMVDNVTHIQAYAKNHGFVTETDFAGPGHFSYNTPFLGKTCYHFGLPHERWTLS